MEAYLYVSVLDPIGTSSQILYSNTVDTILCLQHTLPALDNPLSFRVRGIVSELQARRQHNMKVCGMYRQVLLSWAEKSWPS